MVALSSVHQQECTTLIPSIPPTVIRHVPFIQHKQIFSVIAFFLLLFILLFLALLITFTICRRKLRHHLTAEFQRQHPHRYYYHTRLNLPPSKPSDGHEIVGTNDSLYEQLPSLSSDSEQPFLYNEKKSNVAKVPVLPPHPATFRHHLCCRPTDHLFHSPATNAHEYQYATTTGYSTPTSQQHQCAAILVWANRLFYPNQNTYNHRNCTSHSCPSELQHLQKCLLSNQHDQTSITAENDIRNYCHNDAVFVPTMNCSCGRRARNTGAYIYPHVQR